jgi:acetyl esterase/lipase
MLRIIRLRTGLVLAATAWLLLHALSGTADVTVHENLAYKSGGGLSDYERERCLLDLYLPENGSGYPVIVWFHGGAITAGDKAEGTQADLARTLAGHGIAVASVNYRLSPDAAFPAYIDDAAASVAWIMDNIPEYGGDANKVFAAGHSAGGYLATMVGVDPQYLARYDHDLEDLSGLIPVSGQMVTHYTVRSERGQPREFPVIDAAAPLYFVSADLPPVLAITGGSGYDLAARPEENRYFVASLKAAEHPDAEYLEFDGRTHGSVVSRIPEAGDPVAQAMMDFIRRLSGS